MSTRCLPVTSNVVPVTVRATYRLLAVLVLTSLLLTGCIFDRRSDDSAPDGPSTIAWRDCPELVEELLGDLLPEGMLEQLTADLTYECGTVEVPQDWDEPDRPEKFEIALTRIRHAQQANRIGSLLINPGGPGASGIESAVYLSFGPAFGGLSNRVMQRFDLIGFDPRGVGRSSPVECFSNADLDASFAADPDPAGEAEFEAMVAEARRSGQICADKYGPALGLFSTRQTAHDLDALRRALGDDRLTYLGFSYGTLIGAVYAHLYPERIRAMVLDGAVDPTESFIESSEEQARGFERAFDNFATWCAQHPQQCPLEPDARTAVTEALAQARRAPVTGPDGRKATAGWVFTAVVAALYSQQFWPVLAAALLQLEDGDATGVFDLADSYASRDENGEYTNMFDANTAINCADAGERVNLTQIRQLQEEWREKYPLFGAPLATGAVTCTEWPAPADPYPTGPATGAPPIVVVGTTGDPATPYEATERLAELLGVGVVITVEGEGHTAYPENRCVAEAVNAYLIDLAVPTDGTTCQG